MRITPLILLALLGAIVTADADPSYTSDITALPGSVRRALFEAQDLRDEGEYLAAAEVLENCLAKDADRDHPLLRFHLARALSLADRSADALEHYQAAIAMRPDFEDAWLGLGEVAYDLDRYREAADAFAKGFELAEEKDPRVLHYAAAAYLLAEDAERSLQIATSLVSGRHGEPELDWFRTLLAAALELDRPDRAEAAVERMVELYGEKAEAWELLYQYAAHGGDLRRAAVALTIVGYVRPLTRSELRQLGDLYMAIEIPRQASRFYEEALSDSAPPVDQERLATAYLAAHESDAALAVLERALRQRSSAQLWSLMGDVRYLREEYEEAYRAFEQTAAADPARGRAYLMMGYCALKMDRPNVAIGHLETAAGFPDRERDARSLLERARRMSLRTERNE